MTMTLSGPQVMTLVEHPLVRDLVATLRDRRSSREEFRSAVNRLVPILVLEATKTLFTRMDAAPVRGLSEAAVERVSQGLVLIEILRAAQSMIGPALTLYPDARIGVLGIKRDEDNGCVPVPYYQNLPPDMSRDLILICDPMLATGGSACDAIATVKRALGVEESRLIKLVCVIAAREGVERVRDEHPEVEIIGAALDLNLNAKKYIVPGLGDFGDIFFGTEPDTGG